MNLKRRPRESASDLEFPDALIDNYVSWRDESRLSEGELG
jgi:hypothetical protein